MFREFGPLSGNTMRLRYEVAPKIGDSLDRQTADVDARFYQRIGGSGLLALRARGFQSWGVGARLPLFRRQLRDARLRIPAVRRQQVGVPQRRAALPAHRSDADAARRHGRHPRRVLRQHGRRTLRGPAVQVDGAATPRPTRRSSATGRPASSRRSRFTVRRGPSAACAWSTPAPPTASASRPSRSASPSTSTGRGRRCSTSDWEDALFAAFGGSEEFRKPKVSFWIGYDF